MGRRIRRLTFGLLIAAAAAFVLLVSLLAFYQRSLIYPIPLSDGDVPSGFEVISYQTEDGLDLQAGYQPAREGMPTILFFHGNGVDWQSTFSTTELLASQGYGVLAAEYRGYSGNPGVPSEQGLYRDGRAALGWLRSRGTADHDIVLAGNSLGSGTATQLAQEFSPRALIVISGFKSLTATAAHQYPWAPVDLLLRDRFENIAKIGAVTAPILIVHGTDDQLISISHAEELAHANPLAKFAAIDGAGHGMSPEDAPQLSQLNFLQGLRD